MKLNFTEIEYQNTKSEELLSCLCYSCNKPFKTFKKNITRELKHNMGINKFCSKKCQGVYYTNKNTIKTKCKCCNTVMIIPLSQYKNSKSGNHFCSRSCAATYNSPQRIYKNTIKTKCKNCNKEIKVIFSAHKKSKSGNHFCSQSCAATYNNKHKTTGNRRSKLEKYLEKELINLYPNLEINFNGKITINSELDIYIPSLKLAFELNGIFHYEPIFGQEKLCQIQNNDNRKFQACLEKNIELCIIDTSSLSYFKEHNAQKYLNIIIAIISNKSKIITK
ncbi:MAG: hypothetical protein WC428_00030 [Candidatus Paceibacterota bacterium]|jgi:hypothetical protein